MKQLPLRPVIKSKQFARPVSDLLTDLVDEIDLGRTLLHGELVEADGGRTPEADAHDRLRKPGCQHESPDECTCRAVDYADPTGEEALRRRHLDTRMTRMQNAMQQIADGVNALHRDAIAQIGQPTSCEPQCENCDNTVEATDRTRTKFRGVKMIRSWPVRRSNSKALCRVCRLEQSNVVAIRK